MNGTIQLAACVAVLVAAAGQVEAGVIDSSNVIIGGNSYRTFIDDTTSLTWLDFDNFWDGTETYNNTKSTLVGSGFHIATLDEISGLQASMPSISENFTSDSTIVGGNFSGKINPSFIFSRDLIWGVYDDGTPGDGVSYSWKGNGGGYGFISNALAEQQLFGSRGRDLGAWVVADSAAVPEPTSMALLGFGLCACGGRAYRRRRKATKNQDHS